MVQTRLSTVAVVIDKLKLTLEINISLDTRYFLILFFLWEFHKNNSIVKLIFYVLVWARAP